MTRFADFAALGRRLERTRGRLEKRDEVARCLAALAPGEIAAAVAFLAGRAFPASDDGYTVRVRPEVVVEVET
jgi:hypothetical protein